MDAISFVMGEKTNSLRVKKLSDLIHGASIGKPISRHASVTAKFRMPDGVCVSFCRAVSGSTSDYRIDGQVVSSNHYLTELEKMGINVKAKNFLVFQGAVENIAMKNAKERTQLFEEISGSGLLKDEYNTMKQEMMSAEEETQFTYQKKKGVAAERKEAKLEKQEADRYARLREEYTEKQVQHSLFKLYHNEKDIQRYNDDLKSKQQEAKKIEDKKARADEVLKDKKKEGGKISRDLAKIEQDIREAESEMNKKHPLYIKAKEKVAHTQKKLDGANKTLEQARKADEAHQSDIRKLDDELKVIIENKKTFEAEIAMDSKKRGSNIHLEQDFLKEYDRLKQQADQKSAKYLAKLDSINREQKSDQDLLDSEMNKKTQLDESFKKYSSERDEAIKRKEKLLEHIRSSEAQLDEQRRNKEELSNDVGSSRDRQLELQREIQDVNDQLGDAKNDKHEDARRKKKQEVVEMFKREIPGVYDRMINMCQPTNKRYNVAVTKVLGKYMEAIIVDTEKTARKCIQMLKDQKLEVETFLPLDYLQAKPLKERLRYRIFILINN